MAAAAPADTAVSTKILEFLRKAPSPKKANEVAEHLSITRKEANAQLYSMEKKKMVTRQGSNPVYWEANCDLGDCQERPAPTDTVRAIVPVGCKEVCKTPSTSLTAVTELTEFAVRAIVPVGCKEVCKTPSTSLTAVTELTEFEQRILRFLEENEGKQTALDIAKGVGKQTTKEVNPILYSLKNNGRLIYTNKLWIIKGKEDMATTGSTFNINYIMQNNPINYINQQGGCNTINISESQNTQVGSNNIIQNLTERAQSLPALTYPGWDTATGPAPTTANSSPESLSSHAPRQEVNIVSSTLRYSMIGNNNTMLVSCERDGAEETGKTMLDEETGARRNSGFDSESLSDNVGPSSENEDSACMMTRTSTPRPAQNINIRDSHITHSVIGHDTTADSVEDTVSTLVSKTQRLQLEHDCKWDQTSPWQCAEISIRGSSAQCINIGNNNYMNIEKLEENPESTESEEEIVEEDKT